VCNTDVTDAISVDNYLVTSVQRKVRPDMARLGQMVIHKYFCFPAVFVSFSRLLLQKIEANVLL